MTGSSSDETAGREVPLRDQLMTAGTDAAEQWLATRANRRMSEVNRRRLAGHVVGALWAEIEQAAIEMAQWIAQEQLAAATARTEQAEARLAEIGEVREEWNVGSDDGEPNYIRTLSETEARRIAGWDALAPLRRFVGEWRPAVEQQRQDSEEGTT